MREHVADACLVAFLILFWFVCGVTLLQGWGNYPMWRDMGAAMSNEDFLRIRHAHYPIIYPLAVIPGAVSSGLLAVLLWLRPVGISLEQLWAVFLLSLGIGISTFAVQIPLQDRLDAVGYERAVIERLIETDLWARKIPGLLAMALAVPLTWQAVRRRR